MFSDVILASYPKIIILAQGKSIGKKSFNQSLSSELEL